VPKVTGKTLAAAKTAITRKHCRTGKVRRAYSKRTGKGRVISQSRRAGQVLAPGTKVNLVVSRGRRP
jgi:beta-lactam-binding protein with PASTA domain